MLSARPAYFAYPDAATHAQGLAQAVAALLRHHIKRQGHAVLAVSGGRSPLLFFDALSRADLAWERLTLTLVDERWVHGADEASNGALVCRHLRRHRAAVAQWRPLVAADVGADFFRQPDNIRHTVAAALRQYRQPDVVVLGMGDDGHTASLFPQAPQLAAALAGNAPALLHTTPVTAAHERISMSLPAIAAAANVILAIGGAGKQRILQQALAHNGVALPVGAVLHHPHINTQIFYHD